MPKSRAQLNGLDDGEPRYDDEYGKIKCSICFQYDSFLNYWINFQWIHYSQVSFSFGLEIQANDIVRHPTVKFGSKFCKFYELVSNIFIYNKTLF